MTVMLDCERVIAIIAYYHRVRAQGRSDSRRQKKIFKTRSKACHGFARPTQRTAADFVQMNFAGSLGQTVKVWSVRRRAEET